ncbi:MAG: ATP-binding protein [Lachnospiraceae bacterium]|nr:ATP-binding protein [Lachnospiraceae bacterium]
MRINEFLLYRNLKYGSLLEGMQGVDRSVNSSSISQDIRSLLMEIAGRLIEMADDYGFEGNLWQMMLTFSLANNENPYSLACELKGKAEGSINLAALHDLSIIKELFEYDILALDRAFETDIMAIVSDYKNPDPRSKTINSKIRGRIRDLCHSLNSSKDIEEFKERVEEFYREFGVGRFGMHKAFKLGKKDGDEAAIIPITSIAPVSLEDLIGYEAAKEKLIENTEAFVSGRRANNCLLFGAAGTGKSSSIKGILNKYFDRGLRIIEVYKHQYRYLNDVIAKIKTRNYKFIIYMDDLSFEEFETDYKYLKAIIEGSLEKKPDNVLIYATSNRRHLIKENFSDRNDRDDELHISDTVQEKLSLSSRFGVTIYFGSPDKKEFNDIVKGLAVRYNIRMDEAELLKEANRWELSHGGLSGRTAQSFIDYLAGRE